MIVVDTSLVAYLLLEHPPYTAQAERVHDEDPAWCAPVLWRSELRNVLLLHVRHRGLSFDRAMALMDAAEELLDTRTFAVVSEAVMRLGRSSGCTAYDCEYVALAQALHVPLVTTDREVLGAFPDTAVSPEEFLSSS